MSEIVPDTIVLTAKIATTIADMSNGASPQTLEEDAGDTGVQAVEVFGDLLSDVGTTAGDFLGLPATIAAGVSLVTDVQAIQRSGSFRVTLLVWLSATLAIFSETTSLASDEPIISAASAKSGYAVPEYGKNTQIIRVYRNGAGTIILGFMYIAKDQFESDFFDTGSGKRLAPDRAREIATDNAVRNEVASKNGLNEIRFRPEITLDNGATVRMSGTGGRSCHWPYSESVEIGGPGAFHRTFMVLRKLIEPATNTFERDCESSTGNVQLTTRYRDEIGRFLPDGSGGFYFLTFEDRFLIHFDASGGSLFFAGRSDLAVIPSLEVAAPSRQEANRRISPASILKESEARIDHVVAIQMGIQR